MCYSRYPSGITNHDPTTSPHFVACGANGQVRTFGTARGLAFYMDERSLSDWALYKWREGWRRVEIPHPAVTADELQKAIHNT